MTGSPKVTENQFRTLFRDEYGKLCRYALTYMQDEQLAEDVVQDTFIKIWEQKQDMLGSPNIRFYLATAVRNNCISLLRKQKVQQVYYPEQTPEPEPEPWLSLRERHEALNDRQKKIIQALDLLPPKCREVFLLVKLQGFSYKQAATTLDISVKTVENQMGKALRIFRDLTALFLGGAMFKMACFICQLCLISLLANQSIS